MHFMLQQRPSCHFEAPKWVLAILVAICFYDWCIPFILMQTSLNLKFTHKPLLLIPLPPQESPHPPPSSSLTWSLHSSARAFPVLWVMGGQRFDKPIKGPHVRTIEASDGLCHPFPQSACLSAPSDWHVLSAWYPTPTLRTFNNPHVSQSTTRTPPTWKNDLV